MSSASEHSGRSAAVTSAGGGLGRDIAYGAPPQTLRKLRNISIYEHSPK